MNFIPDGKTKSMSVISHKLDAKETAGGKGKADGANRSEIKKLAGATADAGAVGEDGVAVPSSKKEAKKQAKKDQKKATKVAGKDGAKDEEVPATATTAEEKKE